MEKYAKMRIAILAFCLHMMFIAVSQETIIKNNDLLEFLYKTKHSVASITNPNTNKQLIPIDNKHFRDYIQVILKNKTGLFILVQGTGRIYKAIGLNNKGLNFQRIDSTHHYGYNGGSIYFSKLDTIFSYGGGGFWRINGHLRYFSDFNKEWEIKRINKEIQTNDQFYYLETEGNKIFYTQFPFVEESTGYESTKYIVNRLDIQKTENTKLGELNDKIKDLFLKHYEYNFINIPSLHGSLLNFIGNDQYLINFEKNEVYRLSNPRIREILFGNSEHEKINYSFEINKTIYYTNSTDSNYKVHSFPISMNDFVKETYPLYNPIKSDIENKYYYIGGLSILILSGIIVSNKKKKSNAAVNSLQSYLEVQEQENEIINFNAIEIGLIKKMLTSSNKGQHFSVDDINTALGLHRKTLEIQKKIRTETINKINHKFKVKYNVGSDLIERVRSEEDRRFYKYIIKEENGKMI